MINCHRFADVAMFTGQIAHVYGYNVANFSRILCILAASAFFFRNQFTQPSDVVSDQTSRAIEENEPPDARGAFVLRSGPNVGPFDEW